MTDPREERLPKWAREELSRLRMRLREAEALAESARLATSPGETDAVIYPYTNPIGLPKGERVRFYMKRDDNLRQWVDVHVNRFGYVEILGGDSLRIEPNCSNVIYVKLAR